MAAPAAAAAARGTATKAASGTAARGATSRAGAGAAGTRSGTWTLPAEDAAAAVDLSEWDTTPAGSRRPRSSARTSESATWTPETGAADGAGETPPTAPDTADTPPDDSTTPAAAHKSSGGQNLAGRGLSKAAGGVNAMGGGAILGAFAYVLALTYLRGGHSALVALLRAKFLNQVAAPTRGRP